MTSISFYRTGSPGSVGSLLSPPDAESQRNSILPRDESEALIRMPLAKQLGNGCGTASLAMILTFLSGEQLRPETIDAEIRRGDSFSAPNDLAKFARDRGFNAELYNHGTPEELAQSIDRGVPTQILTSADGSGDAKSLHYVVVTGYQREKDGSLSFNIHNPWGMTDTWSAEQLEERWGRTPLGFDHFYLAISNADTQLAQSRTEGLEGTLLTADGINSITAGFYRTKNARSLGDFFRGAGELGVGVPQAIIGGLSAIGQQGAERAEKEVKDLPVLGKPLAAGLSHFKERIGTLGKALGAISSSANHMHSGIGHFANGEWRSGFADLGRSQLDLGKGIVDVTVDFVKDTGNDIATTGAAIGHAIGDAANGLGQAVAGAGKSVAKFFRSLW